MNVGKIRKYLRNAERVLGLVEGKRHGHHRHHGRGHHGKRRGDMGSGVLRQRLRIPSSRRTGTVLARFVNVAETAENAASPPT